jgi:hypothetical protein
MRCLIALCFSLVCGHHFSVVAQQTSGNCPPFEYSNHKQVETSQLTVRAIVGRAIDPNHVTIAQGCVGLFTEPGHQLIKTIALDDSGNFFLRDVNPGRYRLLVYVAGFCTANVRLRIAKWPRGGLIARRTVAVHMEPQAIDTCSYIYYK